MKNGKSVDVKCVENCFKQNLPKPCKGKSKKGVTHSEPISQRVQQFAEGEKVKSICKHVSCNQFGCRCIDGKSKKGVTHSEPMVHRALQFAEGGKLKNSCLCVMNSNPYGDVCHPDSSSPESCKCVMNCNPYGCVCHPDN